jgi:hypothetical protein
MIIAAKKIKRSEEKKIKPFCFVFYYKMDDEEKEE